MDKSKVFFINRGSNIFIYSERFKRIKKEDFFNSLGVSYSNFKGSNLLSELGSDKIVKILSNYPELNPDWLLTGEGPMLREKQEAPARAEPAPAGGPGALPLLPVRALAGLGSGELQVQISDIDTWYRLPDFPQADFIIPISGDSMLPTYKSGDLAICKRVTHYYNIVWGRLYVVYATEMGALFKRIYPADDDNFVILRSDNAAHYPDIRIKKTDLLNISLVLGIIRKD